MREPILAYRSWGIKKERLVGAWGHLWTDRYFHSSCSGSHIAPDEKCQCGIYAVFNPQVSRQSIEMDSGAWVVMVTLFVSIGLISTDFFLGSLKIQAQLYERALWTLLVLLGNVAVFYMCIYKSYILWRAPLMMGAVALTGKVLYYPNQGFRAEHARILCLIRPKRTNLDLAFRVARFYQVPLFEENDEEKIKEYISELGVVI